MKPRFQLLIALQVIILACAQAAWPQLVDNGDGTVTDQSTGLLWLKEPLPPAGEHGKTWEEAMLWADSLDFAGHDDWRLPSALDFNSGTPDLEWNSTNNEMGYLSGVSLACGSASVPCDTSPFSNFRSGEYWTSTEDPQSSARAVLFRADFEPYFYNVLQIKTSDNGWYTAVRGPRQAAKAPECNDGYDNDSNGLVDYPNDDGCSNAGDASEVTCHSIFAMSCFNEPRTRWWEKCFHIEDSTICIQWVYWVVILLIPAIIGVRSYKRKRSQ